MRVVWALIIILGTPVVALAALSLGVQNAVQNGDHMGITGTSWGVAAIPLWIGLATVFMIVARNHSRAAKKKADQKTILE